MYNPDVDHVNTGRARTIFRVSATKKPFAQLPNDLLRDDRLSLEARGGLCLVLSYPQDWRFTEKWFISQAGTGRDRARRIIREWCDVGYCKRSQTRRADGTLGDVEYVLSDAILSPSPENPSTANPSTDEPSPANPPQTNTIENTNTEKSQGSRTRQPNLFGKMEKTPVECWFTSDGKLHADDVLREELKGQHRCDDRDLDEAIAIAGGKDVLTTDGAVTRLKKLRSAIAKHFSNKRANDERYAKAVAERQGKQRPTAGQPAPNHLDRLAKVKAAANRARASRAEDQTT